MPRDKETVNIDDKVILEYYKLQKSFEGAIKLENSEAGVVGIKGGIIGKEKKKDPLSIIIENVNAKFGTAFTEADKILMQICNDMVNNKKLNSFGKNNNIETIPIEEYFKMVEDNIPHEEIRAEMMESMKQDKAE